MGYSDLVQDTRVWSTGLTHSGAAVSRKGRVRADRPRERAVVAQPISASAHFFRWKALRFAGRCARSASEGGVAARTGAGHGLRFEHVDSVAGRARDGAVRDRHDDGRGCLRSAPHPLSSIHRSSRSSTVEAVFTLADHDEVRAETEIKRSRFIASLLRVDDVDRAFAFLDSIRAEFPDARHHCWAYVLGDEPAQRQARSSDDGVPGGTAGVPMLAGARGPGISPTWSQWSRDTSAE